MLIALCIACQYGDHEGHVPRVSPPEGMLGGSECPCKGDCEMRPGRFGIALAQTAQNLIENESAFNPDDPTNHA